ncbi:MAG: hypothetical protein KDD41_06890, partial [Flavobacteriales bacterium]|nr:hypothetical protein [Flavobacteriales bacterium]
LEKKYPEIKSFKAGFDAKKEMLEEFIAFSAENDVDRNDEEITRSEKAILIRLKALVARNLWDTSAYFEIANELSDSYLKAIEEINSDSFKKEKLVYK